MLQLKNPVDTGARATTRRGVTTARRPDNSVKHPAFKALVALNIIGACVAAYLYFNREDKAVIAQPEQVQEQVAAKTDSRVLNRQVSTVSTVPPARESGEVASSQEQPVSKPASTVIPEASLVKDPPAAKDPGVSPPKSGSTKPAPAKEVSTGSASESRSPARLETVTYTVAGPQVYFHNQPDPGTRRNAFINRWNKAVLKPLDERNGFVYIVYTNAWGQTSKGWMPKNQLKQLN